MVLQGRRRKGQPENHPSGSPRRVRPAGSG
jgi:hypothetical protein